MRPPSPHRRLLRALSTTLLVAGTLVLADVVVTLAWQEPVTALVAHERQDELRGDLRRLADAGPTAEERRILAGMRQDGRRLSYLAGALRERTPEGGALGRLRIAAIGVDEVLVDGTASGDLTHGPGIYEETPLPGRHGTTAVAGHRTTYGAPFRRLDEVDPGDEIRIDMPYATFVYRVQERRIVAPSALWVLTRDVDDRLVLSACHPLYSAAERVVVIARLVRTETVPGGAWTRVRTSGEAGQERA